MNILNNISNPFVAFLHLAEVKFTTKYSNKVFNEHPHKYNLFGLSKMLSDYGIENEGLKVKDKAHDILEIDTPFIAHLGSDFVVVKNITPDKAEYIWNGKNISTKLEEFTDSWSGIVLVAEPSADSIEPGYKENRRKEFFEWGQIALLLGVALIAFLLGYFSQRIYLSPNLNILLAANLAGIYVSYLLVLKQLHIHSGYADKICSLFKQSDCNNILESNAAKLFGVVGWSEVGLSYFISNVAIIVFFPQFLSYLALINICALPYTFWSVWYQKFRAKQWCPLCLIVQGLLWCVFIETLLSGFIQLPFFDISNLLSIGIIYLMPLLLINMLVPKLSVSRKVEAITQEINSIKATDEVFNALLKKQPFFEVSKKTSKIMWGNPESEILVTILTNPHCAPCARMHKRIEKLIETAGNKICIQYIFSSFNEELSSSNKFLIGVYQNHEADQVKNIYSKWFEEGKYDENNFFKKYPVNIDDAVVVGEFEKHEQWKKQTGLLSTPTILINGYELPESYKIEDIKYLF